LFYFKRCKIVYSLALFFAQGNINDVDKTKLLQAVKRLMSFWVSNIAPLFRTIDEIKEKEDREASEQRQLELQRIVARNLTDL